MRFTIGPFEIIIVRAVKVRPDGWRLFARYHAHAEIVDGIPLWCGDIRIGTRLEDGTIVGAPGVAFTPLPICSRCQQPIETDADDRGAHRPAVKLGNIIARNLREHQRINQVLDRVPLATPRSERMAARRENVWRRLFSGLHRFLRGHRCAR